MSAAIVATALVSCADDLGFSNSKQQKKADLTATIENTFPVTRMGMVETGIAPYQDPDNSDWGLGWTEGDEIRVFTVKQLAYNYYTLKEGFENTLEGEFELTKANLKAAENVGENLYAITDAQFVYGVSATEDNEARLTYTIPYRWKARTAAEEHVSDGVDVRKYPAPYWGIAIPEDFEAEGTSMTVSTKALTAFVRVDMTALPAETKYIVFTTHGNKINKVTETAAGVTPVLDGFYLAAPQPDGKNPVDFQDKMSWWEDHAQFITDGKSEAISGTFNTILDPDDIEATYLREDEGLEANANVTGQDKNMMYEGNGFSRLVTRDEIIVELSDKTPAVFYVPIIVRNEAEKKMYENLHVIAATALSKYSYAYIGTEIFNFHQTTFERGEYKFLSLNYENLGTICPATLNEHIKQANNRADRITILNVDNLVECGMGDDCLRHNLTPNTWDFDTYPINRIQVTGTGKLVLNLKAIQSTGAALADARGAVVTDQKTNNIPALYVMTKAGEPTGEIKDKVTVNLPQYFGNDQTASGYALLSKLPAYNLAIGSINGLDLQGITAFVEGSKTKCVTGRNTLLETDGETLKNAKDAGINVVTGLKALNVLAATTGDVYVYNIGEEPEVRDLNVLTQNQIDIRIDNSLVERLAFVDRPAKNESFVYTTGSSAIQKVLPISAVTENNAVTIATANTWQQDLTTNPSYVSMYSYWTGAALSNKARKMQGGGTIAAASADYDQHNIYTVAQLASVGEMDQATYIIPHLLVKDMWLGASTYLWKGAKATVNGFQLDGDNVPLRKLSMDPIAAAGVDGEVFYWDDPHMCCTTCGWQPAIYETTDAEDATEVSSFGLISSYINTSNNNDATIENINLSDVYFVTEASQKIGNIGSIIGKVENTRNFTMQNNDVTEPKIDVHGKYIGGMFGSIKLSANSGRVNLLNNNITDTDDEDGYIKSSDSYVGGLGGYIESHGIQMNNNSVILDGNIEAVAGEGATAEWVGGLLGYARISTQTGGGPGNQALYQIRANAVDVNDILTNDNYAGGIAGQIESAGLLDFGATAAAQRQTESVKADNIKAGKDYAGGFVGQLTTAGAVVCEAAVDIDQELSANQFAGGIFGLVNNTGTMTGNNPVYVDIYSADIEANLIKATEGYAGGEIGNMETGKLRIGGLTNGNVNNLTTDIDIETLSGAYAFGGVIGGNTINSTIDINTRRAGTEANPQSNTIIIDVANWANPQADLEAYFDPDNADSKSHRAGTASNVIGYLTGNLNITEALDFDEETSLFTVNDNLDADAKEAIGYKYHTDEQGNIPSGKWYWGDTNGLVGYGNASYWINGTAVKSQQPGGFNLFKNYDNWE